MPLSRYIEILLLGELAELNFLPSSPAVSAAQIKKFPLPSGSPDKA
jgi:hypothetical protein